MNPARWLMATATALSLVSCASVTGFPADPGNSRADLDGFAEGFGAAIVTQYNAAVGPDRIVLRNKIILERLASYDITFKGFERSLASERNTINASADLLALALTGLSTTAASNGTKTALSAASGGVIGASGAINKDLFYQAALPALLTQMEANRSLVLVDIVKGMALGDDKYPLALALHDLDRYANAGSIPSAISTVTKSAVVTKEGAEADVARLRTLSFEGNSSDTERLVSWLYPGGDRSKPPVPANLARLTAWMQNDKTDAKLAFLPYELLINGADPSLAADRARAARTLVSEPEKAP